MSHASPDALCQAQTPFIGLAPFLRMSISGGNLQEVTRDLLARVEQHPQDQNLWMNLAIAMLSLGNKELGLAIQSEALTLSRIYQLAPQVQPSRLRLLLLMAPGDLSVNTPLDCLLEGADVDLIFYYVSPGDPLALPVPEHDALFVAIGETIENGRLLDQLVKPLEHWPKPVINPPRPIRNTRRDVASRLLQGAPGLVIPPNRRVSRQELEAVADGTRELTELLEGHGFPIIVRPVDSQAGRELERAVGRVELRDYLSRVQEKEFFLSRFVDYSGQDGLFRKYRVALIDGAPYACHMAVSSHWMVHYVNAGMYEDAGKRREEERFMARFDDFVRRHGPALKAIHERTQLDYLCIDCGETRDGDLLIFEVDHAMVVHAMDDEALFPYKQLYMAKVREAFLEYLSRLCGAGLVSTATAGARCECPA